MKINLIANNIWKGLPVIKPENKTEYPGISAPVQGINASIFYKFTKILANCRQCYLVLVFNKVHKSSGEKKLIANNKCKGVPVITPEIKQNILRLPLQFKLQMHQYFTSPKKSLQTVLFFKYAEILEVF